MEAFFIFRMECMSASCKGRSRRLIVFVDEFVVDEVSAMSVGV